MTASVTFVFVEGFENERFLFRAHAAKRAESVILGRALEILERPDVELMVERRDSLRADALEMEQIEHSRWIPRGELPMVRRAARSVIS